MAEEMMEDAEDPKGEVVELDEEEDTGVRDTEDGGAMVTLDNEKDFETQTEHFANIVDDVDQKGLQSIVDDLLDKIERDKDARKKRDEQYEEGIRRTGLGNDAPGGAQFTGANRVVHPLMTEACVDFSARAMKELFPPNGPVRSKIIGTNDKKKIDKAERKSKYMNWQLTEQMPEFRSELEQLTTQLPLGGVQYMKMFWNRDLNRIESIFIPVDDVFLPFAASNFYTAERKTHVQYITKFEYLKRVDSGMYREVDISSVDEIDYSKSTKANDKIEGREDNSYNEDGLRTVFEVTTAADLEGDQFSPYVISIDKTTAKALSVYRNWAIDDKNQVPLVSMVEFPFVPWRGAYPIGLTHMIGGLSGAATGALRALLDSAHISNIPTLLKLKGGPGGQNVNPQPTEVIELEGGINVDDVRKIAMPMPFNPPSPVLMQLLGFLVDSGKGVVQTTFEKLSDSNPNQPVGTTLALIEQGLVVFSSIHSRLHNSMAQVLKVMHRLNAAYLTEEMVIDEFGEKMVDPSDFDGPLDVIPVSDPNIFSETQRFAQMQAVQMRATALPQLYDLRKVEEMFLKQMKIPGGHELLIPKPEPRDMDPIQENFAASVGKPIGAMPEQEHIAHMRVHIAFLQSPLFGQNPSISPMYVPAIVAHNKDHLLMHYMKISNQGLKAASESGQLGKDDAMQEAQAAVEIMQAIEQAIPKEFLDIMAKAYEQAQQLQPPQPQDPTMAAVEVQKQMIQQRAQSDQMRIQAQQQRDQTQAQTQMQREQIQDQAKVRNEQIQVQRDQTQNELEQMRLQAQQQRDQAQIQTQQQRDAIQAELQQRQAQLTMQTEMLRQDREDARKQAELANRMQINEQDNQTAKDLAAAEIISGEKTAMTSGTSIDPNQ